MFTREWDDVVPVSIRVPGVRRQFVDHDVESRVHEYWSWSAIALFLLFPVDLFTTMVAIDQFGVGAETNPFVAWLFQQGPVVFTLVHLLGAVIMAAVLFGLVETIRRASPPHRGRFAFVFEVWLGLVVSLGVFLFVNNVAAIYLHTSFL